MWSNCASCKEIVSGVYGCFGLYWDGLKMGLLKRFIGEWNFLHFFEFVSFTFDSCFSILLFVSF